MRKANPVHRPKGYVLIIVLVVGVAASLAAVALVTTSGGARMAAMHTNNGDLAGTNAQAGMERATAYLQSIATNNHDFDLALDPDLDSTCGAADMSGGASATAYTPTLSDGTRVMYRGKRYSRVNFNGGAYLIRFDDDDDDQPYKADWISITGNNRVNGCQEGPDASQSMDPGGAYYQNNPFRDRNRSIWVSVIGVHPLGAADDAEDATHRRVLRRLYNLPRFPSLPGIRVKGNIIADSNISACSPIGSLQVDGLAEENGSGKGCACGFSAADSMLSSGWGHCTGGGEQDCTATITTKAGESYTLPGCLPGRLEEPGPFVDTLPDPWTAPDDYIDWDRPCIFWVGTAQAGALSSLKDTIWAWDATRDNNGTTCRDLMEGNSPGSIPSPDPAQADTGNASGCWTPIMLDMQTTSLPNERNAASPWVDSTQQCYRTPFHNNVWGAPTDVTFFPTTGLTNTTSPVDRADGRSVTTGDCGWAPRATAGTYTTCDESAAATPTGICTPAGKAPAALSAVTVSQWAYGGLNQKLTDMGLNTFPDGIVLNKTNWATCSITYPPLSATPTTYACSDNGGCTASNTNNVAIHSTGSGSSHLWFPVLDNGDADSVPTAVYIFDDDINPNGADYNWASAPHPIARSGSATHLPMEHYVMATLVARSINLQQDGYFFGAGQAYGGSTTRDDVRYPAIITGTKAANPNIGIGVSFHGGADQAVGGSIYTTGEISWNGSGDMFLFGELMTNDNFAVGGSGNFWWLYQTPLQEQNNAEGGMPPTMYPSPQ
jgi:hypothetical protein